MRRFKKMALLLAPVLVATSVGCATQSLHVSSFKFPTKQKHAAMPAIKTNQATAATGTTKKSPAPQAKRPAVHADRNSRLIALAEKHEQDGNIDLAKRLYQHLAVQQPQNTAIRERLARLNSSTPSKGTTTPHLKAPSTRFASSAPISTHKTGPSSRTATAQQPTQAASQETRKKELLAAMQRRQQAKTAPGRISLPDSVEPIPNADGTVQQNGTSAASQVPSDSEQAEKSPLPTWDLTDVNSTASTATPADAIGNHSTQKASTRSSQELDAVATSESPFFEEVSEPSQRGEPSLSKAEDLLNDHLVMEIVPGKTAEKSPATAQAEEKPVLPVIVPKPKINAELARSAASEPTAEESKTKPVHSGQTPFQVANKAARDEHRHASDGAWWDSVFEDEVDVESAPTVVAETEPAQDESGYDWEPISLAEKFDPRVKSNEPKAIEIDTSSTAENQSVTKWTPTGHRADQADKPAKKHSAVSAEFHQPLSVVSSTPVLQQAPAIARSPKADQPAVVIEDQSWRTTSLVRYCDGIDPSLVPLVRMLDSETESKRIAGLTRLSGHGTEAKLSQGAIRVLLADPSELVQAHAAAAFRNVSGDALRPIAKLTHLLESEDSGVIELAAYHLGRMESEATAAIDALHTARDSEQGITRLHVAEALTRIDPNETESLDILLESLQTGDEKTRWFVAVTLGNVSNDHTTTVVEALIHSLRDDAATVRSAAALSLGGLGKAAFPSINLLTELAETDTQEVKEAAHTALACLDSIK